MRVIFAGGGTGGHVYPAVAIAKSVLALVPDAAILFIGAERGMETELVPKEGFRLETVQVTGLSRRNPLQAGRSVWLAGQSLLRARRIIRAFRPDVAVGTGGYVSGPALLAAARLRIPTLIHEQNAYPGLTTRLLSRVATVVAISHEEARLRLPRAKKTVVTGMPIRQDFYRADRGQARASLGIPADATVVLTVGGSGGALRLNEAIADYAPAFFGKTGRYLLQVTGERYFAAIQQRQTSSGIGVDQWQTIRFMYDMPAAMAAADLVISRAGASTMEEIAAVGVPAIFIPSPNVTDNHQEYNANSLARLGAALVIKEDALDVASLDHNVETILANPKRRQEMAVASKAASHPEATSQLGQLVLELAGL